MPAGKGSMSCSRNDPGRSGGVAWGWGATSQTKSSASLWMCRRSVSVIGSSELYAPGSIPWLYTQSAAFAYP